MLYNYTFEKTSEKLLWRVVHTLTGDWKWYWYGKLDKNKLPTGDGLWLLAESTITDLGWPKDEHFINYIRDLPKIESDRILREATEKGSRSHKAIEMMILSKTRLKRGDKVWDDKKKETVALQPDDWDCIDAFTYFCELHRPFIFSINSGLYSLSEEAAGTTDITAWILTRACGLTWGTGRCPCAPWIGKVGLPDLKTTTAIRDVHGQQVAFFASADNIKKYLKGRKLEYTADLRLFGIGNKKTKKRYEFIVYDIPTTALNYKNFLRSNEVARQKIKPFNPDRSIYQIPESLKLTLVKKLPKAIDNKLNTPKKKWPLKPKSSAIPAKKKRTTQLAKITAKKKKITTSMQDSKQGKKKVLKKDLKKVVTKKKNKQLRK